MKLPVEVACNNRAWVSSPIYAPPTMTQSSGQCDATPWRIPSNNPGSSQRHFGTAWQHSRITERHTSDANHAVMLKRVRSHTQTPSRFGDTIANPSAAIITPTIALRLQEFVFCTFISTPNSDSFLGSTYTSNKGPPDRQPHYLLGLDLKCVQCRDLAGSRSPEAHGYAARS